MLNQSSASPQARPLKTVTQQEAEQYSKMLQEFQTLYEKQSSPQQSEDEVYYIVSVKFLQSWRDFCMSQQKQRQVPLVMNEDIIDPLTKKLKQALTEKVDFQILSENVYNTFSQFHQNQLSRRVVTIGIERRVPIYLNEYKYLPITSNTVKNIEKLAKKKDQVFALKTIEASENATVAELTKAILKKEEAQLTYLGRLWKISKEDTVQAFLSHLQRVTQRLYSYISLRVKGFGKKLDTETKLQELKMEEGGFLVIELKEKDRKWFLQAENEKQCEGCYDYTELKFTCKCQKVAYCTEACQQKDKHFHMRRCDYAEMEELNRSLKMEISEYSRKGKVGLRNLGNTCFMNSCLQCLSNTRPLTQYFLNQLFEAEINLKNPLGTKGKLVRNYALFIKAMWCQRESVYSPDAIKSAVSRINPMFSGYAQHDSQQFFSFIIDGIHQDLNRVQKKPYVQSIESNNRPEKQVATQSWLAHIKRNQSIITDIMTGQYKSKVTCPTCQKQSVTFDPFITVTLPISQKITNSLECFVFSKNFESSTKRINFSYGKPNVAQWKKSISKITGINENSLEICLVSIYQGIYLAGKSSLSEIIYKAENQNKNVFAFELTEEQMRMTERIELATRFCKKAYYSSNEYDNIWFKFPLFYEKKVTNGLAIYKRVLKFLYPTAYVNRKGSDTLQDYVKYEELMLQKRPFKLFLRHNRKVDRHYSRMQFKYKEEIQIKDDTTLEQLQSQVNLSQSQVDVRFDTQSSLSPFQMKKLRDHDDLTKKSRHYDQDSSSSPVELKDCFYNLSQEQELQKGNEWYCSNCKEHKLAKKVIQIYKAPKILILHLKRFKNKGSYRKQKNQTKVHFPQTLDMTEFLIDPTPFSTYQDEARSKNILIPPKYQGNYRIPCSQTPTYQLYAVSNHYGGLGGGHYTAYAKNGNQWYDFNDSSCRQISRESIQGSSAYILFYKRRDE